MKKTVITLLTAWSMFQLVSCYYDKEQLLTPPKTGTATGICQNYNFGNDVNPIIQTSCSNGSGCHGAGSSNGPGALTTYTEIKNAAARVQSSILAGRMPLGTSLSATEIKIITCWINNGTLNN